MMLLLSPSRCRYWSARFNCRASNKGWRLDYALVSEGLHGKAKRPFVRANMPGSDHVPLGVELEVPFA